MNPTIFENDLRSTNNVKAFLKLIRYAEHKREDDDVYFYILGGKLKSYDISAHPILKLNAKGKCIDIAGAYHHNLKTWEDAYNKGIVSDFSPAAQDRLAIDKMISKNALKYVEIGDVENAITRISTIWTALPGACNSKMDMSEAKLKFAKYLREFSRQQTKQPQVM